MADNSNLARMTAEVVSAFVSNSSLSEEELERAATRLPALIDSVHEALLKIIRSEDIPAPGEPSAVARRRPAATARRACACGPDRTVGP